MTVLVCAKCCLHTPRENTSASTSFERARSLFVGNVNSLHRAAKSFTGAGSPFGARRAFFAPQRGPLQAHEVPSARDKLSSRDSDPFPSHVEALCCAARSLPRTANSLWNHMDLHWTITPPLGIVGKRVGDTVSSDAAQRRASARRKLISCASSPSRSHLEALRCGARRRPGQPSSLRRLACSDAALRAGFRGVRGRLQSIRACGAHSDLSRQNAQLDPRHCEPVRGARCLLVLKRWSHVAAVNLHLQEGKRFRSSQSACLGIRRRSARNVPAPHPRSQLGARISQSESERTSWRSVVVRSKTTGAPSELQGRTSREDPRSHRVREAVPAMSEAARGATSNDCDTRKERVGKFSGGRRVVNAAELRGTQLLTNPLPTGKPVTKSSADPEQRDGAVLSGFRWPSL